MKKTILYLFTLVLTSVAFFACEDPYANQTVADPTLFEQPALQDANFVASVKTTPLTIAESNMGKTLNFVTVTSVPSLVDSLATIEYEIILSDATNFATYKSVNATKSGNDLVVDYTQLNDTLNALNNTTAEHNAFARVLAYVVKGGTKALFTTASLPFKVTTMPLTKPYYQVTVKPYYIVGSMGGWSNSKDVIGSSIIPLSVVSGNKYYSDGTGEYTYTGYFKASDEFLLAKEPGNWAKWANNGGKGINNPAQEGSDNFQVPTDGYYTITLDTHKNTCSIVATTAPASSYSLIGMIGGFNGWGSDFAMTPNAASQNHIWFTTITFDAETQFKFRANGGWDTNWGAGSNDGDPLYQFVGLGTNGGKNLLGTAGTYIAVFNDISGCYYIIPK